MRLQHRLAHAGIFVASMLLAKHKASAILWIYAARLGNVAPLMAMKGSIDTDNITYRLQARANLAVTPILWHYVSFQCWTNSIEQHLRTFFTSGAAE